MTAFADALRALRPFAHPSYPGHEAARDVLRKHAPCGECQGFGCVEGRGDPLCSACNGAKWTPASVDAAIVREEQRARLDTDLIAAVERWCEAHGASTAEAAAEMRMIEAYGERRPRWENPMDSRVADALLKLEDEASEARLAVVWSTICETRERLAAGILDPAPSAKALERWAARLDTSVHPVAQELFGPAATARGIYLRAAGALRGRWCERCGEPAEGEWPTLLCNACVAGHRRTCRGSSPLAWGNALVDGDPDAIAETER